VHITGDELEQLISNSLAMEELKLAHCHKIITLKLPCLLHRLNYLNVFECKGLKVIENEAPNLCVVHVNCSLEILRFGDLLQVKDLQMFDGVETNLVHHARAKLPFIMPNLETLDIYSAGEVHSQTSVLPCIVVFERMASGRFDFCVHALLTQHLLYHGIYQTFCKEECI
jgi:hypothetical protein